MSTLSDYLTNIANAIRTKKGTSESILANDFAKEILSIETKDLDIVRGSFTPEENYTSSEQFFEFDIGFKPSAVVVYRNHWEKGIPSINLTFSSSSIKTSITSTANSGKSEEKLIGGSYITIEENGFKISGDSTYYLVGGQEYTYIAIK